MSSGKKIICEVCRDQLTERNDPLELNHHTKPGTNATEIDEGRRPVLCHVCTVAGKRLANWPLSYPSWRKAAA